MDIPPSVVQWFDKDNNVHTSRKVFYTSEDVAKWYKHMRGRIYGLSLVVPLGEGNKKIIVDEQPQHVDGQQIESI